MKKIIILLFAVLSIVLVVNAQPSLTKMKSVIDREEAAQPEGVKMKLQNSTQAGIVFKKGSDIGLTGIVDWLGQKLELRNNEDRLVDDNKDVQAPDGVSAKKFHQYFKGVKVEHGVVNVTSVNNKIFMLQLEFYSIPNGFVIQPSLPERGAFEKALQYMNAKTYVWEQGLMEADRQMPVGELVIIQDYLHTEANVCLAYKFNIYSLEPLRRSYIYVDAITGRIVLDDPIIKHAKNRNNTTAAELPVDPEPAANEAQLLNNNPNEPINNIASMADTRYNGRRPILADLYANPASNARPYRLRAIRNNHKIIVLDYQRRSYNIQSSPSHEAASVDFTDNDNNWTAAEYHTNFMRDGATDVMDNMIWVSDYWKSVHDRNSWNNNNGDVINYVHVWEDNKPYNNAYWNGENMHFGDGNGTAANPSSGSSQVATSLDDCAHELGHGITESTSALVYRWESGALNESMSDIWAACVTNYAKTHDATMSTELTWRLFEKSSNITSPERGLRDMMDPTDFGDPSTYHSDNWWPGDILTCYVPRSSGPQDNDNCGVHVNSGVLNKWFYLITQGEDSTNTKGNDYYITGLGFAISQKIAYLMELNLTPNAGYGTAMTVSLHAAATLYGYGSTAFNTVKSAWAAVGVDTASTYNMANTSVFTTNNFTAIAVGNDGYVFAGTNYSGFYEFDGADWTKRNELLDVRFNDLKSDFKGDIWVAQSGRLGSQGGGSSISGGVNHLAYPYAAASTLYTVNPVTHLPSRNARCMFVDIWRQVEVTNNPKVWVATLAYFTSFQSTSGALGQGFYNSTPAFRRVSEGINIGSGTAGCLTVGGTRYQVWTFSQANFGVNQLLVYSAETNALVRTFDHTSEPLIPSGFIARAIYGDRLGRVWIGLSTGGVMVYDENQRWHQINFPTIFPEGTGVNFNAITGNLQGDVYIGTNNGMVYFDAGGGWANRLDDSLYYRLYGKANGLMSNNINAICYDRHKFKLWVASDSGIVAWDPPCIGRRKNCWSRPNGRNSFAKSKGNGNWSDTAIWEDGIIPDSTTVVYITDTITVDINAECQSLTMAGNGQINVITGRNLKIYEEKELIETRGEMYRRRER